LENKLDKYDILRIGEILEKEFGQCLSWTYEMTGEDYVEAQEANENLAVVLNRYISGDRSFKENYERDCSS